MQLDAHVTAYISRPPPEVFDAAVACEKMPHMLRSFGPIPGVTKAELLEGKSLAPGVRRQVSMTDGSKMMEEILAIQPPSSSAPGRHEYRWMHAPAPPFSLLIRSGHASWAFTPERDGTRVDWRYKFELTTLFAYPLAVPAIALFRRWMQQGLDRLQPAA